MCSEINLPNNFHVWYYFFQALITARAKILISKKVSTNSFGLQDSIEKTLSDVIKTEPSEGDLRWYTWKEEEGDVSRTENKHLGARTHFLKSSRKYVIFDLRRSFHENEGIFFKYCQVMC